MGNLSEKLFSDVFYTSSLIEQISRDKLLPRRDIVNFIGRERLAHLLSYAQTFHCEVLEKTAFDVETNYNIPNSTFDCVGKCKYTVPSAWDIGKVYARLIDSAFCGGEVVDTMCKVFNSFISDAISNFNSDFFYQSAQYIYECYKAGEGN